MCIIITDVVSNISSNNLNNIYNSMALKTHPLIIIPDTLEGLY